MNVYGMALLIALAILIGLFLLDKVSGKNMFLYLNAGKPILSAVTLLAKAIGAATNNEFFNTVYTAMSAAVDATERAENLWLNGHLKKHEREEYATLMISQAMQDAGIEVNENVERIIDGTVALV